jgi:uncharacterized protein (TIGR00299 family) protein
MTLGALVDAGVPLSVLQDAVAAVVPGLVVLSVERVTRAGIAAAHVHVDAPDQAGHRQWGTVRELIENSALAGGVRIRALAVFAALAEAEGRVHGIPAEQVHFHEVGALDAIADIVGAAAGLEYLGVSTATGSTVSVGGGTVRAAHGRLPVPGPAVVALLAGVPTAGGPIERELTTPTGAAILVTTAASWGPQPPMIVRTQGFGAGSADPDGHPNVLRIVVGDPLPSTPSPMSGLPERADTHGGGVGPAVMLEATVDDLDPRIWPGLVQRLLDAGAHDAWLTAALGKKGRPVQVLSVLTDVERLAGLRTLIFGETSTIGLRETAVTKTALARQSVTVTVADQRIRVKLALDGDMVVNVSAEWEDVAAAAVTTGLPAKQLLAQAVAGGWTHAEAGTDSAVRTAR